MSVWANAAGKPQLTYAERLRRATQTSASQSGTPGSSSHTAVPNSGASKATLGQPTGVSPAPISSGSSALGASSAQISQSSSAPRHTLVTSPLVPSSASSASTISVSPQTTSKDPPSDLRKAAASVSPALPSSNLPDGESRPGPSSRPETGRGSISGLSLTEASSSPISSHAATANASVNGDDAASTTHSVYTDSSLSAPPSTSTAPTSVNSPNGPASTALSSSSSMAGLAAASNAAVLTPAAPAGGSAGGCPPVNVWEVRKKAMLEKQRLQDEAQRRAREQAQSQAKDSAKAANAAASWSNQVDASSGGTSKATEKKHGAASSTSGKSASTSPAASISGARSSGVPGAADRNHQKGPSSGSQSGRALGGQQSGFPRVGGTSSSGAGSKGQSRHKATSSTASATSISGLSVSASSSKGGRSGAGQQANSSNASIPSGVSGAGEGSETVSPVSKTRSVPQSKRAVGAEADVSAEKPRSDAAHDARDASRRANGPVEEASGVRASAGRRAASGQSGANELPQGSRSSNLDSTATTTPPSQASEEELLRSPSLRDTSSSSTMSGAALPFTSPRIGPHMGGHHHGGIVYGHASQHGHHHGYAPDLGAVPLAPLPPSVDASGLETAVSASAGILRSPPQPSADYDNTWLERIHMLNGGENMPVYGPLALASTRKHAEDDADKNPKGEAGEFNGATRATPPEDLAAVPVEKDAIDGQVHPDAAHRQSTEGSEQQEASEHHLTSAAGGGAMLYPDTRSRARRRSSGGHKGRKAGALAALATGLTPAASVDASGAGVANGAGHVAAQSGDAPDSGADDAVSEGQQASEDPQGPARESGTADAMGRDPASSAEAAAPPGSAEPSTEQSSAGLPNGRQGPPGSIAQNGSSRIGPSRLTKSAHGTDQVVNQLQVVRKSKDKDASAHVRSTESGDANSESVKTGSDETDGKASDASHASGVIGRRATPAKPLDTQVTRALEGSGTLLSPRPAHLPATPPPSLHPITSPGANGPIRGQSPFNGGQGRGPYSRMLNGAAASQSAQGLYDHVPNGGALHYNPAAAAIAASMWQHSPSSPLPYHRPHRINKDGSFSPTRAADYAVNGVVPGAHHGSGSHDGSMHGSGGSGYGRGMGGKRGRGGRGGWRGGGGGGAGGSGPRGRDYSISSSTSSHHGSIDPMHTHGASGAYDPRYVSSMAQVPQVYYVPYPVPVPYATITARSENAEPSTTSESGTTGATSEANAEQASEAGPNTSVAAEGATPPPQAAGFAQWQQGVGIAYPYYNTVPFLMPGMVPNMVPPDSVRAQALSQLDFYFSPRNLEGDFFLRQRMDSYGWVPIPVVAGFKKVRQITADVNVVRDAMLYSHNLEVDVDNWRVRKRYGWEEYVLPAEQQVAAWPHVQATAGSGAGDKAGSGTAAADTGAGSHLTDTELAGGTTETTASS
ncbi:hypothetical protein V8E36_004403 [Tilletia maclaganii]